MSTNPKRVLQAFLTIAAVVSMSACAVHTSRLSSARKSYDESAAPPVQSRNTYAEGAAIGAALGALAGALLGNTVPGGSAVAGAVIGTAAGALAGTLYADHVVRQRQKYANAGVYLEACTASLRAQVVSGQAFNSALERDLVAIEADRRETDAALRDARAVHDQMGKELRLQQQALDTASREHVSHADLSAHQAQLQALNAERERLAAHIERLTEHDRGRRSYQ